MFATLLLLALPTQIAASSDSQREVEQTLGEPQAGDVIGLPTGASVALPEDWSAMSVDELQAIGLVPDMQASPERYESLGANLDVVASLDQESQRKDAQGCSDNVCIQLLGTGGVVRLWTTQGENEGLEAPFCTFEAYWINNDVVETGPEACGGIQTYYGVSDRTPLGFSTRSTLCNTWVQIYGKPCKDAY